MNEHSVSILPEEKQVRVPTGTLLSEAIGIAGLEIQQPCGGQGRCGRCAVIVEDGGVRRRSTIRLTAKDLKAGYALACQAVVEGNVQLTIPPQEQVSRRLVTDRSARKIELPFSYDPAELQTLRALSVDLDEPSLTDQIDDLARLERALRSLGVEQLDVSLENLTALGPGLRQSDWSPNVLLDFQAGQTASKAARLIQISPDPIRPLGAAIDIGTTTVTVYLVDLENGEVLSSAAEYNGQIACGEDVISRIVYADKGDGLAELQRRVIGTIGELLERIRRRKGISPEEIGKAVVVGNTTMVHLFLGLPPASIRLAPFVPTVNHPPLLPGRTLQLPLNPEANVDCLPGVASYVGADITAGVLASGMTEGEELTLFLDIGTNGEMVLGNKDWLVTCACSAGPAFEGAGVVDGMRATLGAIEEVWVHSESHEPTIRVIGGEKPKGICGSGLISLLAELFVTGVIDKGGNFNLDLPNKRVRQGDHGPEYVIVWADETETGRDIALTKVDVDNLMRAKAAIYAGFSVLASSVGTDLAQVERVLIGGAFGKYINVEKAVQIGLLPDLPWDRFQFLGNTAVMGAYRSLLSWQQRDKARDIADSMTYVELSADNSFYEAFTAALFLPHTEIDRFPSVADVWQQQNGNKSVEKTTTKT